MSDWCIENDFATQREQSEVAISGLQADWRRMKTKLDEYREQFEEYKNAMEWEMESDWVDKVLEKYREQ